MLQASDVKTMIDGVIAYERNDYTKEGVIVVAHTIDGESSVRFGQINVNIHVPDIVSPQGNGKSVFNINFPRLIEIRAKCVDVLKSHYEVGQGISWTIGRLNPPIKERNHDEHFVTVPLELTVREK